MWEAGPLRVYRNPLDSARLEPAKLYAPYGLGYAVPVRDRLPLPDGLQVDLELIDGVLRCVGIAVGEQPPDPYEEVNQRFGISGPVRTAWLSGTYMRDLAVDRILVQAAQLLSVRLYRRPRGEIVGVRAGAPLTLDELLTTTWDKRPAVQDVEQRTSKTLNKQRAARAATRPRGRPTVSRQTIALAALHAKEADRKEWSRTQWIQSQMGVTRSTAQKYKRLAIEAGLLPSRATKEENRG